MPQKDDVETSALRDLYCGLMEEIKRRVAVIQDILSSKIPLPQIVAYEVCYLQLRMICELIALGCLAAHGDLLETSKRKLIKEYNADRIMKQLQQLHSSFFPQPGRQVRNPVTDKVESIEKIDTGFLSKDDLLTLYGNCGDALHRGSLKRILYSPPIEKLDFDGIRVWVKKIIELLNHHQIQLIDEAQMFWVVMNGEDGQVHGALMEKVD